MESPVREGGRKEWLGAGKAHRGGQHRQKRGQEKRSNIHWLCNRCLTPTSHALPVQDTAKHLAGKH